MNNQTTKFYTSEQREEWQKEFNGPGLYSVEDAAAKMFAAHKVRQLVDNPDDPGTELFIGTEEAFLEHLETMVDLEVIDSVMSHQPKFFRFEDREHDGEWIARSLWSEEDAERFRNFIATSVEKLYHPIKAVWVAREDGFYDGRLKYIDRILDVAVFEHGKLVRTNKPVVFDMFDNCEEASFHKVGNDAASIDWREKCKSFGQLSTKLPSFLADGLIPEKCLTAISGHSFNSKSWVAMQTAWSISKGERVFGHFDVVKPVPVIYHVPEMHEAQVRYYADVIGIRETEDFLFRTMEDGVWPLNSPEMLASASGRAVFLDTSGFFNPGDDGNAYKQALEFGKLVFELLNGGALAVVMLAHLAKPSQGKNGKPTENDWTLENSIIGSAGYGAVLRSLLRVKNLNEDLNDHNVHLYVQGMKNPGLKPFQLQGPAPLKMLVRPGDSPYLKQLLSGDAKYTQACVLFENGSSQRDVSKQLGLSLGKVNKLHKEWKEDQQDTEVFQGGPVQEVSHE
ncbi:MAG: AAA family ATPase [Candidatus Micrarchaeaceae archaeon]